MTTPGAGGGKAVRGCPSDQALTDQCGGTEGAIAQAIDRLMRRPGTIQLGGKLVGSDRLTGLGPAQPDPLRRTRRRREVGVETAHALDFGSGDIEASGDNPGGFIADARVCSLDIMQNFDQGVGPVTIPRADLFNRFPVRLRQAHLPLREHVYAGVNRWPENHSHPLINALYWPASAKA